MNIVLSGYFGFGNLGDELILTALLDQLRRLVPKAVPVVLSGDPKGTRSHYGVRTADRWDPLAVFRALRDADALVSGGGGLLQDETGPLTPGYYAGTLLLAGALGKTVVGWGQGIGPLRIWPNPWLARRVVRAADLFMVRDAESKRSLGVEAGVAVGADLAFGLPWTFPVRLPARGRIAVVLRSGPGNEPKDRIIRFLDEAVRGLGYRFKFIAFQEGPDGALARELCKRFPGSPAVDLLSPDRRSIIEAFGDTSAVLSMRYHGLVLASLFGRPGIGLIPSKKIDRFVREFGQESLVGLGTDAALRLLARVLDRRNTYARRMLTGAAQARARLRAVEPKLARALAGTPVR